MTDIHSCSYYCDRPECIKAQRDELRERLAQPEQPSAPWSAALESVWGEPEQAIPEAEIYKREWVELTDEVIWLEYQRFWPFHPAEEPTLAKDIVKFARAIEAKLKEKNT